MNIFIDNKSDMPIYEQIISCIKTEIINGNILADEPLPSIRNLAKDLRISVITTRRAYDELEREGFIYTIASKGCFAAPQNTELLKEENLRKIEEHIEEIMNLASRNSLSEDDIIEMIKSFNKKD